MASASGVVGPVGALQHDPGPHTRRVLLGDLVLERRRNQHVAVELERVERSRQIAGCREVENRPGGIPVTLHSVRVEPSPVGDGPVVFGDPDDAGARLVAEPRSPVAHFAEPLDDDALALEPERQPELGHGVRLGADLTQNVEQPSARRFGTSVDAALVQRFAGDAPQRVNLVLAQYGVGVGDPGHLPAASAVIGCRHVDRRADEVLAHQLAGVASGDALDLVVGVGRRVDLDRPLGTTERDIDDGALERHQRRQRHHLIFVHLCAVADAALERQPVMTVFDAPRPDDFERAVGLSDREVEAIHGVAPLDLVEQPWRMVAERGRAVKGTGDVGKKAVDARHDGMSGRTPDYSAAGSGAVRSWAGINPVAAGSLPESAAGFVWRTG